MKEFEDVKKVVLQAKHDEAVSTLKNLGVFLPFDETVQAFHGRVNVDGKPFVVKSNVDNSGSKMGHYNMNGIAGLHASNFEIALMYSKTREGELKDSQEKRPHVWQSERMHGVVKGKGEVHKIVALKPNLLIFDFCRVYDLDDFYFNLERDDYKVPQKELDEMFSKILNKASMEKMKQAISNLASCHTVKTINPKIFHTNPQAEKIFSDLQKICVKNQQKGKNPYVFYENIENYLAKRQDGEEIELLVYDLAGSLNVLEMLKTTGNMRLLLSKYQSNIDFVDDTPINLQFLKSFLAKENIVGVHQTIWSSKVIDKNNFEDYFFFDTSQINTEKFAEKHTSKVKTEQSKPEFHT